MEAELFDGTVLEFPDGTDPAVIQRVVKEQTMAKRNALGTAPTTGEAPGVAPTTPEQPSTVMDMAGGFGSGIVRGLTETAMLPVTGKRMIESGMDYLVNKGDALIRSAIGAEPRATPLASRNDTLDPAGAAINSGQDAVRGAMDATLYQPKTTAGEYAQTIGEFAAPGALPSKAARAAPTIARRVGEYVADFGRNAVIPAVTSETAGQLTEGTAYEPAARVAGALMGSGATAAYRASNAPEAVLRRAVGDPNAVDWERALGLQNNTTGVRLTGPEAIAQAQGGGSALPNLLRVVEGSIEGRTATAPFFAARPGQVDSAVGNFLDQIAPQSANPSTLGPLAANAAERAISASPEGLRFADAIFGAGPRVTPLQAGETIQPALRAVFDRREGMRNALADQGYENARRAAPTIPVDNLGVEKTVKKPGYTKLNPGEDPITGTPQMQPSYVPAKVETPSMTSNTGPDLVQVDARPVLKVIDQLSVDARSATAKALRDVRGMLFKDGGVDTSVRGLESARTEIGDMVSKAKQNSDMQAADRLLAVQRSLDEALQTAPGYKSAIDTYRAASEPLAPFQQPGLAKVVAKDEFGKDFTLPPEKVASILSTPSEARNFVSVAPTQARDALANRVATDILDRVTDANGVISGPRLFAELRNSEDMLATFPDVKNRLQAIVDAESAMTSARSGPVGQVAAASDTAAAGNAILPQNPLVGSGDETVDAVRRLVAQDPQTTTALIRQNLADRYARASTETQQGIREFSGAKYHKDVAGNEQRRQTLDAALSALPNGAAAAAAPELLDVLQATGRRMPIGSATEFNRALSVDLGTASPAGRAINIGRTLGASFLTNAGDAVKRGVMRQSVNQLADMFTDPQSVELIRAAMLRAAPIGLTEAAQRAALQSAISGND